MNKLHLLFISMLTFLFFGCKDEVLEKQVDGQATMLVNKPFERLAFTSDEELQQAILNPKNNEANALTRSMSFISLLSQATTLTRSAESEGVDYYEALGYDSLIPNLNFARLINPNGEIMVKDTIYKISPNGTYFFHKSIEGKFAEVYQRDSLGLLIADDLYSLGDGIFRYNTFKGSESEDEIDLSETADRLDKYDDTDENTNTRASIPEPNYSSFSIFRAERHTFFGKIRESLLGKDKYYSVRFSKKRRVRGRFYAYNYVAYSEAGVTGMMQKKNWIGWSKTQADELRVEWKNVFFRLKIKDHSLDGIPALPNELNGAGVHDMRLPNGNIEKTIILYNADIKQTTVEKWFGRGLNEGLKALKRSYGSTHIPNDYEKIQAAILVNRASILIIPRDEKRKEYNTKSMTHVFAKKVHFEITINPTSLPKNVLGWAKTLQGTIGQEYPKLETGEVIICGRLGSDWRGMKITAN